MRSLAIFVVIAMLAAYIPADAQSSWVTIVSPGNGEILSGRRAEVSVSYSTGTSDKVTRVEIDVDGARYGVKYLSEPSTRGVSSFTVDTTTLGNGAHKLVTKVYSGDRLIGSSSGTCRIGNSPIDVLPPSVKFADLRDGQELSGTAQIEVVAADGSGEDPLVSVFIDRSLKLIKNTPPYTYAWDTTDYENGRHKLEATAYDSAGNKGEGQSIEIMVRNSGPAIQPAPPAAEQMKPLASASSEKTVASAPKEKAQPVIPVERRSSGSAARAPERTTTPSAPANSAQAKPDRPARRTIQGEDKVVVKPAEKQSIPAAATSAAPERAAVVAVVPEPREPSPRMNQPSVPAEPSSSTAEVAPSDTPVVVATASESSSHPAPSVAPSVKSSATPSATLPTAEDARQLSANVIASLPSELSAHSAPSRPSAAPPVATGTTPVLKVVQPDLRSVVVKPVSPQKLARPEVPLPKPVRMARAPKPEPPAIEPALEPQRLSHKLLARRKNGYLMVELRDAIEATGGTILAWDHSTKTVLAAVGGKTIKIHVNGMTAVVGGNALRLSCAPFINRHGRTMVDVHFLKALLGDMVVIGDGTAKLL